MNGARYFEETPWQRCCAQIAQRNLGPIYEIAIQAVCSQAKLEETCGSWYRQCQELLGHTLQGDILTADGVRSFVGSAGDAVVRIFVDVSEGEATENFEIVTAKSLIVWKPGTSLQGRTSGGYTCCRQQHMADLEAQR